MMFEKFNNLGKIDFALGGQFGSEGKGAAAAFLTRTLCERNEFYDIVTSNAGVQSGHTSIHNGNKRVLFHLPTAGVLAQKDYPQSTRIYLNAGSIIDPDVLWREVNDNVLTEQVIIHPNAAIITDECREAEMRADSAQTKIASTRKGVGEALSRKILRSGGIARNCKGLKHIAIIKALDLNQLMQSGASVLAEVPQGVGLSLNGPFYPHTTSRDCTVMQAMSDAGVHPSFMGQTMLVLRTFPIRVGNIIDINALGGHIGHSGGCYPDQQETSWGALGVQAEITTVTKRVRRVFTWSQLQLQEAMALCRPDVVYLTFADYLHDAVDPLVAQICRSAQSLNMYKWPQIIVQNGPTTDDAKEWTL